MSQPSPPNKVGSSRPTHSRPPNRPRLVAALIAAGGTFLVTGTGALLWPRTYEARAAVALDGRAKVAAQEQLAGKLESALLARVELALIAPELSARGRSADEVIAGLRAGIQVQARPPLTFQVIFRGGRPEEVERVANRLAERGVLLLPKLVPVSADEVTLARELASRTQAVTSFLAAHPEITVDQGAGSAGTARPETGLALLRSERALLERRARELQPGGDNPYTDPVELGMVQKRITEIEVTISAREAALRRIAQERTASAAPPELLNQWRKLLADLATAQGKSSQVDPPVGAHISSRAARPQQPIAPSRYLLVGSVALLTLAAGVFAALIPPQRRRETRRAPGKAASSGPPDMIRTLPLGEAAPVTPLALPPGPRVPSNVGPTPLPAQLPASTDDSVSLVTQRLSPTSSKPPKGAGVYSVAPDESTVGRPVTGSHTERLSPLASARPPGAVARPFARTQLGLGGDLVSALQHAETVLRSDVEIPTAEDARAAAAAREKEASLVRSGHTIPTQPSDPPGTIMSRPPALDPEAERWAARFDSSVPPNGPAEAQTNLPRTTARFGKTQVMGSMVDPEVFGGRGASSVPPPEPTATSWPPPAPATANRPSNPSTALVVSGHSLRTEVIAPRDVPSGWQPPLDLAKIELEPFRSAFDNVTQRLVIVVSTASPHPAAKTRTAAALSLSLAAHQARRVLLLEGDFDRPEVHKALGLENAFTIGFSQQLVARAHGGDKPWAVLRCSPFLHLLGEGRFRSPGALLTREFVQAVTELQTVYDVLVINAPPTSLSSDLEALDAVSNAAVMVNERGAARFIVAERPIHRLEYAAS